MRLRLRQSGAPFRLIYGTMFRFVNGRWHEGVVLTAASPGRGKDSKLSLLRSGLERCPEPERPP